MAAIFLQVVVVALDAWVEAPPGNGEFVVAHKCFQQELLLN
jgi:hypothetical protein